MIFNKKNSALNIFLIAVTSLVTLFSEADQVYNDDVIVQGNSCVGTDCVNGESFSVIPLNLKENNIRIKIEANDLASETITLAHSSEAGCYISGNLGDSWNLNANDSSNGGGNYFAILQSTADSITYVSDGSANDYTCTLNVLSTESTPLTEGVACEISDDCTTSNSISTPDSPVTKNGMNLTQSPTIFDGGVSLGFDAEVEDSTVAVGTSSNLQRLVHVDGGNEDVDVLSVFNMSLFAEKKAYLRELEEQVDTLENRLKALKNSQSSGGSLSYLWLFMLGPLLYWRRV